MFNFFKSLVGAQPSADEIIARVGARLVRAGTQRAEAGQRLTERLISIFPEANDGLMLLLATALTDRLVERHWKAAAPAVQVAHQQQLAKSLGEAGATDFADRVRELRTETDILLDSLLDAPITLGALQGFADMLGEATREPTINGFDPLRLAEMLDAITTAELAIRPTKLPEPADPTGKDSKAAASSTNEKGSFADAVRGAPNPDGQSNAPGSPSGGRPDWSTWKYVAGSVVALTIVVGLISFGFFGRKPPVDPALADTAADASATATIAAADAAAAGRTWSPATPIRITDPDGVVHEFPAGTSDEEIDREMTRRWNARDATPRDPQAPPSARATISGDGIGGLRLGMTRSEVLSMVQITGSVPDGSGRCLFAQFPGLPGSLHGMFVDGALVEIWGTGQALQTPRGVGVGSTVQAVMAAYGADFGRNSWTDGEGSDRHKISYAVEGRRWLFMVNSAENIDSAGIGREAPVPEQVCSFD